MNSCVYVCLYECTYICCRSKSFISIIIHIHIHIHTHTTTHCKAQKGTFSSMASALTAAVVINENMSGSAMLPFRTARRVGWEGSGMRWVEANTLITTASSRRSAGGDGREEACAKERRIAKRAKTSSARTLFRPSELLGSSASGCEHRTKQRTHRGQGEERTRDGKDIEQESFLSLAAKAYAEATLGKSCEVS